MNPILNRRHKLKAFLCRADRRTVRIMFVFKPLNDIFDDIFWKLQ